MKLTGAQTKFLVRLAAEDKALFCRLDVVQPPVPDLLSFLAPLMVFQLITVDFRTDAVAITQLGRLHLPLST